MDKIALTQLTASLRNDNCRMRVLQTLKKVEVFLQNFKGGTQASQRLTPATRKQHFNHQKKQGGQVRPRIGAYSKSGARLTPGECVKPYGTSCFFGNFLWLLQRNCLVFGTGVNKKKSPQYLFPSHTLERLFSFPFLHCFLSQYRGKRGNE